MKTSCPLGYFDCSSCEFRQEVSDCGYTDDLYYERMVQAMAKEGMEIVRQDTPRYISGITTAQNFTQALYNAALEGYRAKGYRLVPDGQLLILYFQDKTVFIFDNRTPPTLKAIQAACYMNELRRKAG